MKDRHARLKKTNTKACDKLIFRYGGAMTTACKLETTREALLKLRCEKPDVLRYRIRRAILKLYTRRPRV